MVRWTGSARVRRYSRMPNTAPMRQTMRPKPKISWLVTLPWKIHLVERRQLDVRLAREGVTPPNTVASRLRGKNAYYSLLYGYGSLDRVILIFQHYLLKLAFSQIAKSSSSSSHLTIRRRCNHCAFQPSLATHHLSLGSYFFSNRANIGEFDRISANMGECQNCGMPLRTFGSFASGLSRRSPARAGRKLSPLPWPQCPAARTLASSASWRFHSPFIPPFYHRSGKLYLCGMCKRTIYVIYFQKPEWEGVRWWKFHKIINAPWLLEINGAKVRAAGRKTADLLGNVRFF